MESHFINTPARKPERVLSFTPKINYGEFEIFPRDLLVLEHVDGNQSTKFELQSNER